MKARGQDRDQEYGVGQDQDSTGLQTWSVVGSQSLSDRRQIGVDVEGLSYPDSTVPQTIGWIEGKAKDLATAGYHLYKDDLSKG